MHRFSQNFLPASFERVWIRNNVRNIGENEIQLRNNDRLRLAPSRLALTDRLPTHDSAHTWELFPINRLNLFGIKIVLINNSKIIL